jgi:hypothetical protein
MAKLELQPITFKEAQRFINKNHSHHRAPSGWVFGVAVNDGEKIVGVAMAGKPLARLFDDGWTLEITRCCTDHTQNVASKLYGALVKAGRALGYKRIITYTLKSESGVSLSAANWRVVAESRGGTWNRKRRPRVDNHPTGQKLLWEPNY